MNENSSGNQPTDTGATTPPPGAPTGIPLRTAYPIATPHQIATALPHKTRGHVPWLLLGLVALAGVVVGGVLTVLLTPVLAPRCSFNCAPPPPPRNPHIGSSQIVTTTGLALRNAAAAPASLGPRSAAAAPLMSWPRYRSSAYGFALEYDPSLPGPSKTTSKYILWSLQLHSGPLQAIFTGGSPNGAGAQQIVQAVQQNVDQSATQVYQIPGAEIGYTPGYGAVYNSTLTPATGPTIHMRLVVIAAIKKGLAVVAAGVAPFATDQEEHPDPAQTIVVHLLDPIINTVTWPGDPPL